MTRADKMFEELGFDKEINSSVIFYNQKLDTPNPTTRTIVINDFSKTFEGIFTQSNIGGKGEEHFPLCISMKELQAIYEFCKEKGWLDVK